MAEKYRVLRRHVGDKDYHEGDERTAEAAEVKHLVDQGVLQPIRAKAEAPAKNKAEPAPKNKGA
jgi:hypothetical protein